MVLPICLACRLPLVDGVVDELDQALVERPKRRHGASLDCRPSRGRYRKQYRPPSRPLLVIKNGGSPVLNPPDKPCAGGGTEGACCSSDEPVRASPAQSPDSRTGGPLAARTGGAARRRLGLARRLGCIADGSLLSSLNVALCGWETRRTT